MRPPPGLARASPAAGRPGDRHQERFPSDYSGVWPSRRSRREIDHVGQEDNELIQHPKGQVASVVKVQNPKYFVVHAASVLRQVGRRDDQPGAPGPKQERDLCVQDRSTRRTRRQQVPTQVARPPRVTLIDQGGGAVQLRQLFLAFDQEGRAILD